jgi:IS30 family transposase
LSSNGSNKKGKMVDWRRNKVQQLLVRGYSQWDVAEELQIDQSTVSRDIQYLRHQAQQNLQKHIQQKLPEEYHRCLTGMNQVLKLSWQIANNTPKQNDQDHNDNINTITTGNDRTRLQALSLINDCYKYIMDLTTNGVVITDAIKFVQTNKEKLSTMSTKDDDNGSKELKEPDYQDQLEEEQEEKTGEPSEQGKTTNQVF